MSSLPLLLLSMRTPGSSRPFGSSGSVEAVFLLALRTSRLSGDLANDFLHVDILDFPLEATTLGNPWSLAAFSLPLLVPAPPVDGATNMAKGSIHSKCRGFSPCPGTKHQERAQSESRGRLHVTYLDDQGVLGYGYLGAPKEDGGIVG
jgi:hypothetical protein